MDEQVGAARGLGDRARRRRVAGEHDLPARTRRPEHRVGRDRAAVGERDRLASLERPAQGAVRDAQRLRRLDVEAAGARLLDEGVADRGHAVRDGERDDRVAVAVERVPRTQLDEVERVGQLPEDAPQRAEEVAQAGRPVDGQRHVAAAERERLQHPGQAEVVIRVVVGHEDLRRSTSPTVERSSWRCVPSPQSTSSRSPPRRTSRPDGPRCALGMPPDVPRKTTSRSTGADCRARLPLIGARLRKDERLARAERRSGQVIRLLDPVDRVARVAGVARGRDRPQRVVRLDDVDLLRRMRPRRADESAPDEDRNADHDHHSCEHAFDNRANARSCQVRCNTVGSSLVPSTRSSIIVCVGACRRSVGLPGLRIHTPDTCSSCGTCVWP